MVFFFQDYSVQRSIHDETSHSYEFSTFQCNKFRIRINEKANVSVYTHFQIHLVGTFEK